jgi:23S rRNA pseudouridine2605 synthase
LRRGVHLAEGVARVVSIQVRKRYRQHTDLEIVLNEGKNREIRRILARVGHKVMLLRRLAVGPVRLGDLPLGATRRLTGQEVAALVEATSRKRTRTAAPRAKPATETFREATFTERPAGTRAPRAAAESTARVAAERTVRGERDSQVRTGGARPPKTFPAAAGAEPRRGAAAQVAPAARSGSARPPAKAPAAMSPSPQPPAAQSLAAAPPKLDLAMLLDPRSAPKVAMAVGPAKGAAARPEVGDVLDYDSGDQASVQGFTSPPTGQSRRRSVVPTTPPLEIDSEREPPLDAAAQARPSDARPARPDRQERPARARGKAPAGSSRGRPRPAGRPGQKPEGASRSGAPVREARSERGRAAPATRKGSGSSPRGAKSGGRRAAAGPAPRGKTGTGRAGFGKKGPGKKGRRS